MKTRHARVASGLAVALGMAALLAEVWAQPAPRPTARTDRAVRAPHREAARQWAASVDAGDAYPTPAGPRRLRRLADAVAVTADPTAPEFQAELLAPGRPLEGFASGRGVGRGLTLLTRKSGPAVPGPGAAAALAARLQSARATAAGRTANPVFIDPATGLRLLATADLIVQLRPGVEAKAFFGAAWAEARPAWGAPDQYVLRMPGATAEAVLAEVTRLAARPEVLWAEPDFISQMVRTVVPNDPLFPDQWHLRNEGQFGAVAGADARLPGAWDFTLGSSNVVVALIDDGVQIQHPDLAPNIFRNAGEEPDNGLDDDGNGLVDDVHGWDFFAQDKDPSPAAPDDNHGTALAGLVAAVGNNGLGVSGAAPRCRILPLKILTGEGGIPPSEVSRVLYYAAGLDAQGQPAWRGADVISLSLLFASSQAVDAALNAVTTRGRGGLGCPVFCAAGNSAAGWVPYEIEFPVAGTYTLRWQFGKDYSDEFPVGADTVWLDTVIFPDGTYEDFEAGWPAGWGTGGDSPWQVVTDGVGGNHALTGWGGPGSRAVRAGHLRNDQTNWVETTTFVDAGVLRFWAWVESEAGEIDGEFLGFDFFSFLVDGEEVDYDAGVPLLETGLGYPASHPATVAVGASTDFDYRADYSQFGAGLDLVAPSDGGAVAITTTDRTGLDGYNGAAGAAGDYAYDFGGTSAATPLAAGVGALVLSMNPYLPAPELRTLLRGTCDHVGNVPYNEDGFSPLYGYGRLNAQQAVSRARPNLILTLASPPSPVMAGDVSTYVFQLRNNATSRSGIIRLTNQLPAGVLVGPITPEPALRSGNLVVWQADPLPGGGLLTFTVVVTNTVPGTNLLVASAGTDVPETSLANNALTHVTVVLAVPLLTVQDAAVLEGDTTATGLVFQVTLSHPSLRTVTTRYATLAGSSNGTATVRRDFAPASGLLTFQPGQTNRTIAVRVLPDRLDEEDETFTLQLSGPAQAILDRARATGIVLDNDPLPTLSIGNAVRTEGNTGAAPLVFTVRLSPASGRPVSVPYTTGSGSALAGSDFVATNGTLVFPPGVTVRTLAVPVLGDRLRESNETFLVTLGVPTNATLGRAEGLGTLLNNDAAPRVFIEDATGPEGDADGAALVFSVRLSSPSGLPVQVAYATAPGSAGADDFVATNGVVTFAPGETQQTVVVALRGDTLSESNEVFRVLLSQPVGAVFGDGAATGTLLDDDPLPQVVVADVTVAQLPGAATNALFTVTLSAPSGRRVSVRYATANGTALAGLDYTARAGVLTLAPGVTQASFHVPIAPAAAGEGTEEFQVNFSAPVNATLATLSARGILLSQPSASPSPRTYAAP